MRRQRAAPLAAPVALSALCYLFFLGCAAAPAAAERLTMPSPPVPLYGPDVSCSCDNLDDAIFLSPTILVTPEVSAVLLHVHFSFTPPVSAGPGSSPASVVTVRFGSPPYSDGITLTTSGATVTGEAIVIVEYTAGGFVNANISCNGVGNVDITANILGQFVPNGSGPPVVLGFSPNFDSSPAAKLTDQSWDLAVPDMANRNLIIGAVDGQSTGGPTTWQFGDGSYPWASASTASGEYTTLPFASHSSPSDVVYAMSSAAAKLAPSYQLFGWFTFVSGSGMDFTPVAPPQLICISASPTLPANGSMTCPIPGAGDALYAWISVAMTPVNPASTCTIIFEGSGRKPPYITWDGSTVHTMSLPVELVVGGNIVIRSQCDQPIALRVALVGLFGNNAQTTAPPPTGTTQPPATSPPPTASRPPSTTPAPSPTPSADTTPPPQTPTPTTPPQTPTPSADTTTPPPQTPAPALGTTTPPPTSAPPPTTGVPAPSGPPMSGPPRGSAAPTTPPPQPPQPPPQTLSPSLAPQTPPPASDCTGAPPVFGATCAGGAWWLPSLNLTSTVNISNQPIVIGTTLNLDPGSVTVITPTANSSIFIIVQGTARIDGTLIVDLSGRNYSATYTTLAVVRAGALQGGYDTIRVEKAPQSCEKYSAWTAQTSTTLNAVLLRDDSNCKSGGKGVGRWGAIAGGVVFGSVLVIIGVLVVMFKTGVLSPTSFIMLARNSDEGKL